MVFFDNSLIETRRQPLLRIRLTLPLLIALAAIVVGLSGLAMRGFSENGLRFGTQLIWRFNLLVFFAALVAGPIGRLTPLTWFADKGRPLLQGFCAVIGVHAAFILLPNLFAVPNGTENRGITAGMSFFILFNGTVALALAAAVNRSLCARMGEKACRAMLGISVIYFWLSYSLIGLAHITGPHQHDPFYELSVILMIIGLLARFADRFFETRNLAAHPA